MSTKTTFKRIALVAVAALGLGVLSVAPSSAVATGLTVTVTDGKAGLPGAAADSTTAGIINVAGLLEATDSVTVEIVAKSFPFGAATPASQVYLQNLDSTTPASTAAYAVDTVTASTPAVVAVGAAVGTFAVNGATTKSQSSVVRISKAAGSASSYVSHNFGVQFDSITASGRIAGTYTYTVLVKSFAATGTNPQTTIAKDINIVIAKAASTSTTVDATKLSAYIASSNAATADANVSVVATADATTDAYIYVTIANAAGDTTTALDSVTATVTGPGVISFDGTTWGKSIKVTSTGNASIQVRGDGTAGTSSIAVTTLSGLSVTKTLSFYAKDPKTITPSVFTPILGLGANDSAAAVTAVDANGLNWTGGLYIYPVAAADALVSGSVTAGVACVPSADKSKQYCPITTKTTGTASFKVGNNADPLLATVTSAAWTVTVSNVTPASVKLAFDKTTYAPGEKAVVTVTPLDASGNKVAAVSSSALVTSAGINSNVALTVAGTTKSQIQDGSAISTDAYDGTDKTAGSYSIVVYMPFASGTVTLAAKGGSALPLAGQVAVTASAAVVNASVDAATDAANEATDAANAATDAALAAADAADAATAAAQDASDAVAALSATVDKLVASLKAQITSLTNLVIKIQKKVKA